MATAAVSTTSKEQEAARISVEVGALAKEVSQLQDQLEHARQHLGVLQDKRRALAEAVLDGKPQKSTTAEIHAQIAEAMLPIEVLQPRLTEKQRQLDQTRERLAVLNRELSIAAQHAALQARFDDLKKRGGEIVPRISGAIRNLLELLAEYDEVRDGLRLEFSDTDKTDEARELVKGYGEALWDRSMPRAETELLAKGWTVRQDLQFICRNLTPPKR